MFRNGGQAFIMESRMFPWLNSNAVCRSGRNLLNLFLKFLCVCVKGGKILLLLAHTISKDHVCVGK